MNIYISDAGLIAIVILLVYFADDNWKINFYNSGNIFSSIKKQIRKNDHNKKDK